MTKERELLRECLNYITSGSAIGGIRRRSFREKVEAHLALAPSAAGETKTKERELLLADFRDCVLNQRGALAENGMNNEQVNDVLAEFDNRFTPSAVGETEAVPYVPHIDEHGNKSQAPFLTPEQLFRDSAPSLSGEEIEALRAEFRDYPSESSGDLEALCDLAQSARKARGEAYEECARICEAFAAKYPASFTMRSEFVQATEAIRQAAREGGGE